MPRKSTNTKAKAFSREELQDILDKAMASALEQKKVTGTFENIQRTVRALLGLAAKLAIEHQCPSEMFVKLASMTFDLELAESGEISESQEQALIKFAKSPKGPKA